MRFLCTQCRIQLSYSNVGWLLSPHGFDCLVGFGWSTSFFSWVATFLFATLNRLPIFLLFGVLAGWKLRLLRMYLVPFLLLPFLPMVPMGMLLFVILFPLIFSIIWSLSIIICVNFCTCSTRQAICWTRSSRSILSLTQATLVNSLRLNESFCVLVILKIAILKIEV